MANPLDDILKSGKDFLGSIFKEKATSVVGVDIGSAALKVVQLKKEKGHVVLETYGEIALGPYEGKMAGEITNLSPEKLAQALNDILKEANITSKTLAVSIQSAAALVFMLRLPKISERDLGTTIPNEARKYIPVPLSEVSLDWWVLPESAYETAPLIDEESPQNIPSKNETEVFVAAIRNDAVTRYQSILKEAKLSSVSFEMEIFSAIRSTFRHELSPTLLVDYGASGTRIAVVEYGIVKKFHTVNRGSFHATQSIATGLQIPFDKAEQLKKEIGFGTGSYDPQQQKVAEIIDTTLHYIFSEISTVLLSYEKEYKNAVQKIILVGGGSLTKGFLEKMRTEFPIDVEYGDSFSKTKTPSFLENALLHAGPEFAVSLGTSLKGVE